MYNVSKSNLHMNDAVIDTYDRIFRTLQEMNAAAHTPYPPI
jgi:hypothetical protein